MATYVEKTLHENETILGEFRLHWIIWVEVIIWSLLGLITFGITVILAVIVLLRYYTTEYAITTDRVVVKRGIISRNTEEIKIPAVEGSEIKQGVIGRIFGFGTIEITGRGGNKMRMNKLSNPLEVKKIVEAKTNH